MTFKTVLQRFLFLIALLLAALLIMASSGSAQAANQTFGPDIRDIKGWWANIYPWSYNEPQATTHAVPELFTNQEFQNFNQVRYQNQELDTYGSGLDIITFSPYPDSESYNWMLGTYFTQNTKRPYFILYVFDGWHRFKEPDGQIHDMSDPFNRQQFMYEVGWMLENIFLKFPSRTATYNGKPIIYLWNTDEVSGDLGSLLEEAKKKYSVCFFGSNLTGYNNTEQMARLRAVDGVMSYMVGDVKNQGNYLYAISVYRTMSFSFRQFLRKNKLEKLVIPTFQAAYDDHLVPGRSATPMYPRTKAEVELHAQMIKDSMGSIYDNLGPFVVYNEVYEGAAVMKSQCLPPTQYQTNHYVGCGTARLELVQKFFGK